MVLANYKAKIALAILNKDLENFKQVTNEYFSKMTPELDSEETRIFLIKYIMKGCIEYNVDSLTAKEMINFIKPLLLINYDLATTFFDEYKRYYKLIKSNDLTNIGTQIKDIVNKIVDEKIPFTYKYDIIVSYIDSLSMDITKIANNKEEIQKYLKILSDGEKNVTK